MSDENKQSDENEQKPAKVKDTNTDWGCWSIIFSLAVIFSIKDAVIFLTSDHNVKYESFDPPKIGEKFIVSVNKTNDEEIAKIYCVSRGYKSLVSFQSRELYESDINLLREAVSYGRDTWFSINPDRIKDINYNIRYISFIRCKDLLQE